MNAQRSDSGECCQHDLDWESHLLRISITCDIAILRQRLLLISVA
jgi:hypothetical protein